MKALYLSTIAFVSYKSMVMALPTELERNRIVPLPDHAAEAGPVLENRDIHPSCVISLAACLIGYGLTHFEYKKTYIPHKFSVPWTLCASAAILEGSCKDGIGSQIRSEPGQMFSWHRQHDLTEDKLDDCISIRCDNVGQPDAVCESIGCGNCGFGFCMP